MLPLRGNVDGTLAYNSIRSRREIDEEKIEGGSEANDSRSIVRETSVEAT